MHSEISLSPQRRNLANRAALFAGALFFCGGLGLSAAGGVGAPPGSDKPYAVVIEKTAAKRGQPATVKVLFKPASGWHINTEYPTQLQLKPPADVTISKPNLTKQDAQLTQAEGRFNVVLTGSLAGKKTVPGVLTFAVCTDTSCNPQKTPVAIELEVQ